MSLIVMGSQVKLHTWRSDWVTGTVLEGWRRAVGFSGWAGCEDDVAQPAPCVRCLSVALLHLPRWISRCFTSLQLTHTEQSAILSREWVFFSLKDCLVPLLSV